LQQGPALAFASDPRWAERPVAVVPMPSEMHPQLILSMAAHVAAKGLQPLVESLRLAGPMPMADLASGAETAALLNALALRTAVELPAGPLLLIDARYRSGGSTSVAAALLREAGAPVVLPLVLHQLP